MLFGFGPTATSVDSLIVEWPSGLVTTQTGVATDDTLTLSEPTLPPYALTDQASNTLFSHSASWGDYDGDGDLDLHVANYGAQVDSLYRNDAGVMTPVAVPTMTTANLGFGGAWGDYDGDGDLDLSVGILAPGANQLWRNDGVRLSTRPRRRVSAIPTTGKPRRGVILMGTGT